MEARHHSYDSGKIAAVINSVTDRYVPPHLRNRYGTTAETPSSLPQQRCEDRNLLVHDGGCYRDGENRCDNYSERYFDERNHQEEVKEIVKGDFHRNFHQRPIRRSNSDHENRKGSWAGLRDEARPPSRWERQQPSDKRLEAELFCSHLSGVNFDRYEETPVEACGENIPAPILLFAELKLHPWIEENIRLSGYTHPTPVQKYSIPALIAGRDLMACAQTGSGKTAAFLVPVINAILQNGPDAQHPPTLSWGGRRKQYPLALVLSPTRELSLQIHNESRKFSYRTPIKPALLYGGRGNFKEQINKLRSGCHILIATPGRLLDVMEQDYIGLNGCRYLVLDEADRLLDMGFEPQIRRIVDLSTMPHKGDRVTAMFFNNISQRYPGVAELLRYVFVPHSFVYE
ncbi:Sphingosine N-acyltransferase [Parelaphostrongylus tenuis]|uniref:RNA helicase n=1 Tax=Parelaphostrongylus tenuis TaxID=148309 RepID=A0AAD5MTT7_PARTN|nr:Sphingosine N-acyltransferase [Parelaphostrongylus tenuis]